MPAAGCLTWEAVRQTPEGGVWSLAADPTNGDALRQMASRFPEPERPVIMIGDLEELDYLLQLRGEEDLQFDRIIGRNPFTRRMLNFPALAAQLLPRLLPGGQLCLAQIIPRHTQRLYELFDWSGDAQLLEKVRIAEEAIYADLTDPLVNWDETDLAAGLQEAGCDTIQLKLEPVAEQRFITAAQLDRWFSADQMANDRAGYGQRLQESGLTADEIKRTETLFRRHLLEKQIPWHGDDRLYHSRR